MRASYPADQEALDAMSVENRARFELWFADLEAVHKRYGSPYGEGSLAENTGIECWMTAFEEGMSATDALDEDLTNA